MRPHSQSSGLISQSSPPPRVDSRIPRSRPRASRSPSLIGLSLSLSLFAVLLAPSGPASADVELVDDGRHSRTGPKSEQATLDGIQLLEAQTAPPPSGHSIQIGGRLLTAKPTQPVSVGLLGCPGCMEVLLGVGGVYLEVEEGRMPAKERHRRRTKSAPFRD